MFKRFLRMHYEYLLSFFFPALLVLIYFAYRKAYPFGSSSLLTVDLGQQYIDFFAFFKSSLLHHPQTFIYAFSKDLGGDMVGVTAYYLISPFNLIFLVTPQIYLPVAVYFITVLKFGCAGLSSAYFFKKSHLLKGPLIPAFGISFALMSFLVVNHFNLMWLDSIIMLPLVMLSLYQFWQQKYNITFAVTLAMTILLNYYIGFMVALFSCLVFLFQGSLWAKNWKDFGLHCLKFMVNAILTFLLTAFLLLPTLSALAESKGTYTVTKINWRFEFTPWHLILKLILGSFNFDQMSTGMANIFVGSLPIFGFLLFFTLKGIRWQAKVVAGLISIILLLSLCYEPLDLLWHGGQFPVWYPYRFSFVVSFWFLLLAAYALKYNLSINKWQLILLLIWTVILIFTALNAESKFNFLSHPQIMLTAIFMLLILVMLTIRLSPDKDINYVLLLIVATEMTTNLFASLNGISYLNEADYSGYTSQLISGANAVKAGASEPFYRIAKTYERTKNDPMEADYNGASQFNSMMEPSITKFFAKIGQPMGDGFVTYNNGTMVTDALLDMQYIMHERQDTLLPKNTLISPILPVVSSRPDISEYNLVKVLPLQTIHYNPFALPIAFLSSTNILHTKDFTDFPLAEQEAIFHAVAPKYEQPLFTAGNFKIHLTNMKLKKKQLGMDYQVVRPKQAKKITLIFHPDSNDPYYLTWGSSLTSKVVDLYINGKHINLDDSYQNTLVFGVADNQQNQTIKIELIPKKKTLWLDNISLFKLNTAYFKLWANTLQNQALKQLKQTPLGFTGWINVNSNQLLMTTIPKSKGWHVQVDGQNHKKFTILNTFVGVKLNKGTHNVRFYYRPPYWGIGLLLSVVGWTYIGGFYYFCKRKQHRS